MIRFLLLMGFVGTMVRTSNASLSAPIIFTGTCDASAVVAVGDTLFAVANDEDNFLRFYRFNQPGPPVQRYDLRPFLLGAPRGPEADIEGAARLGARCFFITSHGRNAEGKVAPARHRLFALELEERDGQVRVQPVGKPCTNLLAELSRDPKLAQFHFADAAKLAPKERGSLNIEALTDTPQGGLLIGFRSPIPGGRALLVPLLNPNDVIAGQTPQFGDAILLDLGGLGLRGIVSVKRGYYVVAGPDDGDAESRLFFWEGGESQPRPVPEVSFSGINPEALCFRAATNQSPFLILSDDGSQTVNGQECKDLPEAQRRFRAYWFAP